MTTLADDQLVLLLRLTTDMGTSTDYQYTTAQASVTSTALGTFAPALFEVTMEKLTGRADNETIEIEINGAIDPLAAVAAYTAHAPVDVTLWVADLSDVDATERKLWQGRMVSLSINDQKRKGIHRMEVAGGKRLYQDRPLGIACTSTCAWRFGDAMCGVDVAALSQTQTVSSISGSVLTVGALTVQVPDWWTRGYVKRGDLAIPITEYRGTDGDPLQLTLAKPAPPVWVGQSVVISPGCDKSLNNGCRKWANEERFGGFGYAIPQADPGLRSL